jgi:RsiW-degrading membrane proteinase PrsW (M82 family)
MIILILISSIPVIVVYVWYRLAKYQLSLVQFLFALLAGAAAFFPALFLQDLLNISFSATGRGPLFYQFFIRIALTEELSRLLMLLIFFLVCNLLKPAVNTVKKGTAIGLVAGFGFAILENAGYAASDMRIGIVLLRFFTIALHGACGSRIGAAAILFRSNPVQAFLCFFSATAIHGIYNFMVTIPGIPSIAAVFIAISALTTAILTIRGSWDQEPKNPLTENPLDSKSPS